MRTTLPMHILWLLVTAGYVGACANHREPTAPPAAEVPASKRDPVSISVASGDSQAGVWGAALRDPLIALVTDAAGKPAEGAVVRWSVQSGEAGLFQQRPRWSGPSPSELTARTSSSGLAGVFVWPSGIGVATIAAELDVPGAPQVVFTAATWTVVIELDWDWFVVIAPGNGRDLSVPVGTTLRWIGFPSVSLTSQLDDSVVDSGPLERGQEMLFTADAPGVWNYSSPPETWAAWASQLCPVCRTLPTVGGTITVD